MCESDNRGLLDWQLADMGTRLTVADSSSHWYRLATLVDAETVTVAGILISQTVQCTAAE
jgi:hypothetical protein